MQKNTYIVIIVLVIISLSYSIFTYFSITQGLEFGMFSILKYFTDDELSDYSILGNESLYLHQSICDFEVERSDYTFDDQYYGKLGNCNRDKIIEFYNSKNFSKEKVYSQIAYNYAVKDIKNSYGSVINELYPHEKHLFYEKIYDAFGTSFLLISTGKAISEPRLLYICDENLNKSGECAYELFRAEKNVTQTLLNQINFDSNYVNSCVSNTDILRFPLDANAFCSRLRLIYSKTMGKSLAKEQLDHSKFLIILTFYYLNNPEDHAISFRINNMIAQEIDPKYKPYFEYP